MKKLSAVLVELAEQVLAHRIGKLDKYPFDDRFVFVCGTTPEGNVHVEWTHKRIKQSKLGEKK